MIDYPDDETGEQGLPSTRGKIRVRVQPAPAGLRGGGDFSPDHASALDGWQDVLCRHAVFPCTAEDGAPVLAAGTYADALRAAQALGLDDGTLKVRIVNRSRIVAELADRYAPALTLRAVDGLRLAAPEASAASGFPARVRWAGAGACGLFLAGLALAPGATVAVLWLICAPYLLATMILRTLMMASALRPAPPPPPPRRTTPVVSILVPVYGEADSLPALVSALDALDYPVRALDIKILLEEDDAATVAEARRLTADTAIECLVVPPSAPRTKPKAMNFALPFVRGEIVGIFDAEDAPEPAQISKAVATLEQGGKDVVCAQARLSHYNAEDNALTRCVAMEYALWFDLLLNGLARAGMPIPLGGTSLYFRGIR